MDFDALVKVAGAGGEIVRGEDQARGSRLAGDEARHPRTEGG